MKFNERGEEILDTEPVRIPVRFTRKFKEDDIQRLIRTELSRAAREAGHETFEEANDFDVEDEEGALMPMTEHEFRGMEDDYPDLMRDKSEENEDGSNTVPSEKQSDGNDSRRDGTLALPHGKSARGGAPVVRSGDDRQIRVKASRATGDTRGDYGQSTEDPDS